MDTLKVGFENEKPWLRDVASDGTQKPEQAEPEATTALPILLVHLQLYRDDGGHEETRAQCKIKPTTSRWQLTNEAGKASRARMVAVKCPIPSGQSHHHHPSGCALQYGRQGMKFAPGESNDEEIQGNEHQNNAPGRPGVPWRIALGRAYSTSSRAGGPTVT